LLFLAVNEIPQPDSAEQEPPEERVGATHFGVAPFLGERSTS
jgi:hypothetical protein